MSVVAIQTPVARTNFSCLLFCMVGYLDTRTYIVAIARQPFQTAAKDTVAVVALIKAAFLV